MCRTLDSSNVNMDKKVTKHSLVVRIGGIMEPGKNFIRKQFLEVRLSLGAQAAILLGYFFICSNEILDYRVWETCCCNSVNSKVIWWIFGLFKVNFDHTMVTAPNLVVVRRVLPEPPHGWDLVICTVRTLACSNEVIKGCVKRRVSSNFCKNFNRNGISASPLEAMVVATLLRNIT